MLSVKVLLCVGLVIEMCAFQIHGWYEEAI